MNINLNSIIFDGIDVDDYPKFVDAYVAYAEDDNGNELSDDELDRLNDDWPRGVDEQLQHLINGE